MSDGFKFLSNSIFGELFAYKIIEWVNEPILFFARATNQREFFVMAVDEDIENKTTSYVILAVKPDINSYLEFLKFDEGYHHYFRNLSIEDYISTIVNLGKYSEVYEVEVKWGSDEVISYKNIPTDDIRKYWE